MIGWTPRHCGPHRWRPLGPRLCRGPPTREESLATLRSKICGNIMKVPVSYPIQAMVEAHTMYLQVRAFMTFGEELVPYFLR